MPALINICANTVLGAAIVLAARSSESMRSELLAWPFMFLLAFEAVFVTPIATYLFRFHPQWSMLYWFDPQIFAGLDGWTGWLAALAVVMNFAAAFGSYAITREGLRRNVRWLALGPVAFGVVTTVIILSWFGDRVLRLGDYDAFWHGDADPILARLAGWIGLSLYAGGAAFVTWMSVRFRGREPRFF